MKKASSGLLVSVLYVFTLPAQAHSQLYSGTLSTPTEITGEDANNPWLTGGTSLS